MVTTIRRMCKYMLYKQVTVPNLTDSLTSLLYNREYSSALILLLNWFPEYLSSVGSSHTVVLDGKVWLELESRGIWVSRNQDSYRLLVEDMSKLKAHVKYLMEN